MVQQQSAPCVVYEARQLELLSYQHCVRLQVLQRPTSSSKGALARGPHCVSCETESYIEFAQAAMGIVHPAVSEIFGSYHFTRAMQGLLGSVAIFLHVEEGSGA